MIKGVGVDIVSVKRIKKILENHGERFLNRILTENEKNELKNKGNTEEFLAGRFAIKEAIVKTLNEPIPFNKIDISYNEFSKPIAREFPDILISISHEREFAVAVAIRIEI